MLCFLGLSSSSFLKDILLDRDLLIMPLHSWLLLFLIQNYLLTLLWLGFPCGSASKESTCNAGDLGSIPGLGRSPGEGNGYPLQYSGLENSVHGGLKELETTERLSLSLYCGSFAWCIIFLSLLSRFSLSLSAVLRYLLGLCLEV